MANKTDRTYLAGKLLETYAGTCVPELWEDLAAKALAAAAVIYPDKPKEEAANE